MTYGALNALANYWITRTAYANRNEDLLAPEINLEHGAGYAFHEFLMGQNLVPSIAFELGLEVAAILVNDPFAAGDAIRDLLNETIDESARASLSPEEGGA